MNNARSRISSEKLEAYRSAQYRVSLPSRVLKLMIGVHEPRLANVFDADCPGGALITAFNPSGIMRDYTSNQRAQARLGERLSAFASKLVAGEGTDPAGQWPSEPSILAVGIDRERAEALARDFGQDAFVWISNTLIPELVPVYSEKNLASEP